ncbi:MAG: 2-oxo acid dehydrogenase subunit E2, partial [Alphaproteobacteria bacterium]|nr:2-oxo acid dehydrogenase subunit E2 [Alphaproteobacteria bacterium]
LNGSWAGGAFRPAANVHLGVAISLRQGGLIAPAIHDADRLALPALMARLRDLVRRARAGGLRSSELADATITVTSLGEQGSESVFPVIYPPQVAIVGFGSVVERPWVVGNAVVPGRVVTASLAADHRVSDGHRGARFLAALADRLQKPQAL